MKSLMPGLRNSNYYDMRRKTGQCTSGDQENLSANMNVENFLGMTDNQLNSWLLALFYNEAGARRILLTPDFTVTFADIPIVERNEIGLLVSLIFGLDLKFDQILSQPAAKRPQLTNFARAVFCADTRRRGRTFREDLD